MMVMASSGGMVGEEDFCHFYVGLLIEIKAYYLGVLGRNTRFVSY